MDFIAELICEVILEGIFAVTVENPRVKTWIKTTVFLVFSQLFTGLFIWMTVDAWRDQNNGWIIVGIIAAIWAIGTIIGAVRGHKRNWI